MFSARILRLQPPAMPPLPEPGLERKMHKQKPLLKNALTKFHKSAADRVIDYPYRRFEAHFTSQLEQMGGPETRDPRFTELNNAYNHLQTSAVRGELADSNHFDDFLQFNQVADEEERKRLLFLRDIRFYTRYARQQQAEIKKAQAAAKVEKIRRRGLGPFKQRLPEIMLQRGKRGLCTRGLCTRNSTRGIFLQDGPFLCHAPGAAICPISIRYYQLPEETHESSLPTAPLVHEDKHPKVVDEDEACCINESTTAAQQCQSFTTYAPDGGHQGGTDSGLNAATEHVRLHSVKSSSESLATHCTGFERQGDRRVLFPNDLHSRSATSRAESPSSIIDFFMIMEVSQPDDGSDDGSDEGNDDGRPRQVTSCEREYRA